MRAKIVTKLEKLHRRLPPTWDDLTAVILKAGEELNQAEVDAYLAHIRGNSTPEQEALWDEWIERNKLRIYAVWDAKYPGWEDAPFWEDVAEASHPSEQGQDNEPPTATS